MAPDLVASLLDVLRLTLAMLVALFLPLLAQLFLLLLLGIAYFYLVVYTSRRLASWLVLVGMPVHEFSHAIAFLITLGGVEAIKTLEDDAGAGFVAPSRPHAIDGILASLAPLIGGLTVLWLTSQYVIPHFEVPPVALPRFDIGSMTLGSVLLEIVHFLASFFEATFLGLLHLHWGEWRTYAGLYIVLSVCIEIAPSPDDLNIVRRYLWVVLLGLLILAGVVGVVYWSGDPTTWFERVQAGLIPRMVGFSTAVGTALALTFFGVLLFLPFRAVQYLREKQPAAGKKKRSRR